MKLMRKIKFAAILIAVALTLPMSMVVAGEHGGKEHAGAMHDESMNAGDKLMEGVTETAMGWTEAPKEMAETTDEENIVEGMTVGAVKGTANAVVKTTEGAVKAATFFVPDEE